MCALLATATRAASGGAQIRGTVLDSKGGEPLARVAVELVGTSYRTLTTAGGTFEFELTQAGHYRLRATTVGYWATEIEVELAEGEIKEFEILLTPNTLGRTEKLHVEASPFEPLRASSPSELVLFGLEIKNLASVLADDPLRAIQSLPAVSSNDDFDSRFAVRGADYRRVGMYLDDVLLHNPFHMVVGEQATGSLTVFNGDMLESLSLHPSALPSRFGDRTAAAIDAVMRDGSRVTRSVKVSASASNSGFQAEGPLGRSKRGSWLVAARKSYLQYLIRRTAPDASLAFGFIDGQSRFSYELSPRQAVSLTIIEAYSDLDRARAIPKLGLNALIWSKYHLSLAKAGWKYTASDRLLVSQQAAYVREKYDHRNRDWLPLGNGYYGEWVSETRLSWTMARSAMLEAGWSARRLRDTGSVRRYQTSPPGVRLLDDYGGHGLRTGGFVEPSLSLAGGRIHVSAGLRWDWHSINSVAALSPRAGLALGLTSKTTLRLAWGQYTQYPELQHLLSLAGSQGLLPERSIHVTVLLEHRLDERTRIRAELYNREDRDLINRPFGEPRLIGGAIFNPPLRPPIRNSVRGYGRGFDVFIQRRSANRLSGWISYGYGRSRLRDGEAVIYYPSDWDQRHTVNLFASYRLRPTVNLSLRGSYGSGFPMPGFLRRAGSEYYLAEHRNALHLDDYCRVDARINKSYQFDRWRLTLFAEVINLLNRKNYRFDSFDGYNARTGKVYLSISRMFPIIPSLGIMLEWQGR